jgi:hypothetical protein
VDDAVEGVADVLAQPVGQRRQVLGVRHVELDDRRLLRQPLGDPLAQRQAPAEVGQDDGGALLLRDPRRSRRRSRPR